VRHLKPILFILAVALVAIALSNRIPFIGNLVKAPVTPAG
jgi:hypothetical protein